MARINLLPWREERRKQQQQEFVTAVLLGAGLTAALMFYVHVHINGLIENQDKRNDFLKGQIVQLDKKIKAISLLDQKKNRLISKMDVIQRLQSSRPEIVHLFDELAKTIPDGVFLKSFAQSSKKLNLKGVAQSNSRVSAYMRNIDASKWLEDPRLNIIQSKGKSKNSRESDFTLQVKQQRKKPKAKGGKA